ncbi:hypothetical protein COAQ111491_04215 [Comamonas aquatilis]|uniref:PilW family protein n=1 Tax=Comamonas aquatilis TaxID=1778406 RepID=UPI0039F02641
MNQTSLRIRHGKASLSRGFTLVEMMIAMLISIFLSMALAGIYVTLKRNFLSEDSLVNTQENQRLALTTLTNSIQSAGFFANPLTDNLASVFGADTSFTTAGQIIYGASANGKSSLSVRYQAQANDGILNCSGSENDTGANAIFVNTFSINASYELVCTTSTNGGTPATVVLARNISKLDFLYGVDSDSDGVLDSYLGATQTAAIGWSNVRAVRIDLTLMDTINNSEAAQKAMPKVVTQYVNLMNTYEIPN